MSPRRRKAEDAELAHWRHATPDGGDYRLQQGAQARSPLNELRASAELYAKLAVSSRAALRNRPGLSY
jgi:hypothetical protein